MPEQFQYKRMPAKPRKIADIIPEEDIRVQLMGTVIDFSESVMVIDDGQSTANMAIDEKTIMSPGIHSGILVRAFCRVIPLESRYELRAEIIQDMSKIDIDLYRRIME
jgi:phospholipid N-methyltransferase